jgi:hypothetical protein
MNDLIDQFWGWFGTHLADVSALADGDDPFWDIAQAELKRIDKRLWFELSRPDGSVREFIVTAHGDRDAFPLAEAVIARAPNITGWAFIALKPPMGFDFKTNYEGVEFDPCSMWFVPLKNDSRPELLSINIGVPNLTPAILRKAENAVLVILDTALGEREASHKIGYVEVTVLPESPGDHGFLPLKDLADYLKRLGK